MLINFEGFHSTKSLCREMIHMQVLQEKSELVGLLLLFFLCFTTYDQLRTTNSKLPGENIMGRFFCKCKLTKQVPFSRPLICEIEHHAFCGGKWTAMDYLRTNTTLVYILLITHYCCQFSYFHCYLLCLNILQLSVNTL